MTANRTHHVDRRTFVAGATATAIIISGGALIHPREAWGFEPKILKPETMRTLIKMARDIYPHDRLADQFYAVAVKSYDEKSGKDAALKAMVETGVAALDAMAQTKHKVGYAGVGADSERVALLREFEKDKLFGTLRGDLVVSLYNQKEVWPLFGYEGESASKGGYITRGFADITWL